MTYYKYAERDASHRVDWSSVGKTISDSLMNHAKVVNKQQADAEEAFIKNQQVISDRPIGVNDEINEWSSSIADAVTQHMLATNQAFQNGEMGLREFNLRQANIMSGLNNTYDYIESVQEKSATIHNDIQSGKLQAIMAEEWEELTSNLNNDTHLTWIDANTGTFFIGKRKYDKDLEQYTNELVPGSEQTVKSLLNSTVYEYATFDLSKYMTDNTKEIAKFKVDGPRGSLEDFRTQNKEYLDFERAFVRGAMNTPYQVSSILTSQFDGYSSTTSREEFENDPKKYLRTRLQSGALELEFHDEQKKEVEDFLKNQLYARVPHIETYRAPKPITSSDTKNMVVAGYLQGLQDIQTVGAEDALSIAADMRQNMNNLYQQADSKTRIRNIQRQKDNFVVSIDYGGGKTTNHIISRKDKDGQWRNPEIVAREFARIVTPLQGSWEASLQIFNQQEGGGFKPINVEDENWKGEEVMNQPVLEFTYQVPSKQATVATSGTGKNQKKISWYDQTLSIHGGKDDNVPKAIDNMLRYGIKIQNPDVEVSDARKIDNGVFQFTIDGKDYEVNFAESTVTEDGKVRKVAEGQGINNKVGSGEFDWIWNNTYDILQKLAKELNAKRSVKGTLPGDNIFQ